MTEDFDRSFDFFAQSKDDTNTNTNNQKTTFDATFDSSVFEFGVTRNNSTEFEEGPILFPDNPFEAEETSRVAVHEQLSAMYDDFSQDGTVSVTGSIHVKGSSPIRILLKDDEQSIQRLEDIECSILKNSKGQQVIEVDGVEKETLVAKYTCVSKLKPVPILVKSRVSASTPGFVRAGFKIRANPHNDHSILSTVIMIAIPPDIDGSSCRMSRKGGNWEEMKRTITWSIGKIKPGEAIEIQAQFRQLETSTKEPKFPVLVRCDYPALFSKIVLDAEGHVNLNTSMTTRVLHRKV